MKSTSLTQLVLVALLSLAGCGHTGEVAAGSAALPVSTLPDAGGEVVAPYYPLQVGNEWRYRVKLLGESSTQTISILDQVDGWFRDSTGERFRVDRYGLRTPERYLLKGPIARGTRWSVVLSINSTEHYEISAVGVGVSVPAGNFRACLRVEGRNRVDERTTFFKEDTYCPTVGLVRVRTWVDVAGTGQVPQAEIELTSYSLKDGAAS